MSQLVGKNQKIAAEAHCLLAYVARENNLIMGELSSLCLMESLKRNFPKTVADYYHSRLRPEEASLTEMAHHNEKGHLIYDPKKNPARP
jgi:4-alpha-glucanotransferase